jgi:iron complex outermembrane receptor protein
VRALRALAVVLIAAMPFAAPALAAGGDEAAQPEMLLFEPEVIGAATKHLQPAREAPASVTVVTREEIRRYGYRTLAAILSSVPGFYGSYDRNYDYVGVRGFLRPGDYNDRILLLVNGHGYNDDIYQTASLGYEFGIDVEAIERVEVVRGPGSALYGGNALFAVVNVVTATGADLPGVRPLFDYGSYGTYRGQLSVGHVFENGIDVFASGSVLESNGHEDLFYPEYDTPETNNGIAHDADAESAYNLFTRLQWEGFTLQGAANRREKHIPTAAFFTTFNDNGTKTIDSRAFADLSYEWQPLADTTVTTRGYYDYYGYHGSYIYGSGDDRVVNEDLACSNWFGGEVRGRWQPLASNALTVGAEYAYHPAARQKNFDIGGPVLLDDVRSFSAWGLYAQDEWVIVPEHVTLVAGLRYDRFYNRIDQLSPRLAALWAPWKETQVKLLFGQAFRPPNLFEQYYAYASEGTINLANPNLDAEQITSYELAFEQGLWWGVRATASAYYYEVDDLIDQTELDAGETEEPIIQYQNISSARATGGEVELHVPLPAGLSGRVAYAAQNAEAAGGERLTNSPLHLGYVFLAFQLPYDLEGGAELQVIGPRKTLQGNLVPTATLANLNLIYHTPLPGLDASAGFYNLFDQKYYDPAGAELLQDRIEQDRFNFRLELRYAF